jgi:hypothetical protein
MFATREELQRRLTKLEANMPWLVKEYPDRAHLAPGFSSYADEITGEASPEDVEWASSELNRILIKFGFVDDFAP